MERNAARVLGVGVLVYAALVVLPYAVADPAEISVYYSRAGFVGPLGLLAPIGIAFIAAMSGAAERSDPATMAGVAVVMGFTAALLTLAWAIPAGEIAGGMASVGAWFDLHRWALFLAALLVAAGSGGYTAAVLGLANRETKGP